MALNSELRRATEPLIRFFEANQIQYHIGGSVASSAHGIPRTTIDVDLVADIKPHYVEKMVQSLQPVYYIDVFILKQDAFDQKVMNRAVEGRLNFGETDPFQVRFSSPEDIILHKLS